MSFDTLAPHYRWMEVVLAGSLLQRCRTRYVNELATARNVLILGPGRSRFASVLLATAPHAAVTLVDSSRAMLDRLGRDLRASAGAGADRVRVVHADVRCWAGPDHAEFDLVASHFFLDCFSPHDLATVIARVADWTAPRGCWLVSDFQVPEAGWRRRRARGIHAIMYAFFRITTSISARSVTPPDPWLVDAGFQLERRETSNFGLLHADLWRRA